MARFDSASIEEQLGGFQGGDINLSTVEQMLEDYLALVQAEEAIPRQSDAQEFIAMVNARSRGRPTMELVWQVLKNPNNSPKLVAREGFYWRYYGGMGEDAFEAPKAEELELLARLKQDDKLRFGQPWSRNCIDGGSVITATVYLK